MHRVERYSRERTGAEIASRVPKQAKGNLMHQKKKLGHGTTPLKMQELRGQSQEKYTKVKQTSVKQIDHGTRPNKVQWYSEDQKVAQQ